MSKHYQTAASHKGLVEITAEWVPSKGTYLLIIEDADTGAGEDFPLYSSLDDKNLEATPELRQRLTYFRGIVESFGAVLPETFWGTLFMEHQKNPATNP